MSRARSRSVPSVAFVLMTALSCHTKSTDPAASASASLVIGSVPSSPFAAVPAAASSELTATVKDPLFVEAAASHDPIDFAALGAHAGAGALVDVLGDRSARATALAAIPYARDSDLALKPLASAARASAGDEAYELLDTLALITEAPRKVGELLDPEGAHAAVGDLAAIAKDTARPGRERALAVTILGRLADRGFTTRAEIPAL